MSGRRGRGNEARGGRKPLDAARRNGL